MTIVLGPVMFDGSVFWTEVDAAGTGSVFRYDPANTQTSTVGAGPLLTAPTVIGGGLYRQQGGKTIPYRLGNIPTGFSLADEKLPVPVTDGTTSVWAATASSPPAFQTQLLWSRSNGPEQIAIVRSPSGAVLRPLAVAGPYVLWTDGAALHVLDTRTGATGTLAQGSAPQFIGAGAAGGTLAFNAIGAKGRAALAVGRTTSLPRLTC